MNRLLKKVISGAVSVSTVLSALPGVAPASADDGVSPQAEINRHLTVEFLGSGTAPQETSTQRDAYFKESDVGTAAGNEFWVGVAVDNVNDLELFTNGIYSLEIAFEYNSDYVVPYYQSSNPSTQDFADEWLAALKSGNDNLWSSAYYDIVSVHNSGYDTFATDRENITKTDRQTAPWRTCVVNVTSRDTTLNLEHAAFHGLASPDKQYLLKLPFRLVDVPEDTSTEVLSLVRAPETFNIGSGTDGTDPYASWQATVQDPADQTNLKNLFGFDRDISLFGIGGAITDITPFTRTTPPEPEEDPPEQVFTEYPLYQSDALTDKGFLPVHQIYYVSVPNEVDELKLGFKASAAPTVQANGDGVTVSESSDENFNYETEAITLNELDKEQNGGFSNTVTVFDGTTTYTIYIRRLLKPKIELNPGNSPYGEIMRDDSITDKDAAKAAFDVGDKFTADYLPQGMSTDVYYSPQAWNEETDPSKNLDRDDTALFAFEYDGFTDPGFTNVTNSLGEPVPETDITRTISVCVLPGQNMKVNISDDMYRMTTVTGEGSNDVFTNEQLTGGRSNVIQPDIYDLTYSFRDEGIDDTFTAVRKVVILPRMGDTTLDGLISTGDLLPVRNQTFHVYTEMDDTVKDTTHDLYIYRVVDTTYDVLISTGDLLPIRNMTFNIPVATYYAPFTK